MLVGFCFQICAWLANRSRPTDRFTANKICAESLYESTAHPLLELPSMLCDAAFHRQEESRSWLHLLFQLQEAHDRQSVLEDPTQGLQVHRIIWHWIACIRTNFEKGLGRCGAVSPRPFHAVIWIYATFNLWLAAEWLSSETLEPNELAFALYSTLEFGRNIAATRSQALDMEYRCPFRWSTDIKGSPRAVLRLGHSWIN